MAQDKMALESPLFKEETLMGGNVGDGLSEQRETTNAETDKEDSDIQSSRARGEIASTNGNGYKGKYNWDLTNNNNNNKKKTSEKASVTPSSGAIVDYAWCDGKKSVSVYVELPGLDHVHYDDMQVSLTNDGEGVLFEAKNVTGKNRFLEIDKLHKKVKSAKLVRKMGKDMVIIKLVKDDEKRTWYNLKKGGSSSSYGDDDYDDEEPWIPPEDEEALDDLLSETTDNVNREECEAEGVDAPMKEVEETEAVDES